MEGPLEMTLFQKTALCDGDAAGGLAGGRLHLRRATQFFEKGSFPKDPSTSEKLRCATEIQICERLAAFRAPLRSPSDRHGVPDLGRTARKYKDVAKIADLGQEVGPSKAATVWGLAPSWRSCREQAASPSRNAVFLKKGHF